MLNSARNHHFVNTRSIRPNLSYKNVPNRQKLKFSCPRGNLFAPLPSIFCQNLVDILNILKISILVNFSFFFTKLFTLLLFVNPHQSFWGSLKQFMWLLKELRALFLDKIPPKQVKKLIFSGFWSTQQKTVKIW